MPPKTPASVPLPPPRQSFGPYRICLVCLGNICRSPMAEVVLRDELALAGLAGAVEVESAGTGDWHVGEPMDRGAWSELARRGYDGSAHRARQFERSWFARYDLVLAMDRSNLATLRRIAGSAESQRVRLFRTFDPALPPDGRDPHRGEVPDPYGGPEDRYRLAFDLVLPAARGLAARLTDLLDLPAGRLKER